MGMNLQPPRTIHMLRKSIKLGQTTKTRPPSNILSTTRQVDMLHPPSSILDLSLPCSTTKKEDGFLYTNFVQWCGSCGDSTCFLPYWRMIVVEESGMAGGCYPNCAKKGSRKVEDHGMVKQDPTSQNAISCLHD